MADAFKACSVDGCNGNAARVAEGRRGLCSKHLWYWKQYGDALCTHPSRHGMARTRLYKIWCNMKGRCGHTKGASAKCVKNYRDRGIRVCAPWMDFPTFAEWANANGYADDLTIDRIDNDGDYEPGNCRWVTVRDNNRTRKSNKLSIEDAEAIKGLRKRGMKQQKIATKFGVASSSVSHVVTGRTWSS